MKKCKRRHNSKKGVTLVELVVAIAIVSIVFASTMTAIVHGYISIVQNKSLEDASAQAQGVSDTVSTALEKAFSSNKYSGDANDQSAKKDFYDDLVEKTVDSLKYQLTNVELEFIEPSATFFSTSSTKDIQCQVQYLSTPLETSSASSGKKESWGYKVMVDAKSAQGDITASEIVTIR